MRRERSADTVGILEPVWNRKNTATGIAARRILLCHPDGQILATTRQEITNTPKLLASGRGVNPRILYLSHSPCVKLDTIIATPIARTSSPNHNPVYIIRFNRFPSSTNAVV